MLATNTMDKVLNANILRCGDSGEANCWRDDNGIVIDTLAPGPSYCWARMLR